MTAMPKRYRDRQSGEWYTYLGMLEKWRNDYEGIDPETGLYRYDWHTRFEYVPEKEKIMELILITASVTLLAEEAIRCVLCWLDYLHDRREREKERRSEEYKAEKWADMCRQIGEE